MFETSELGQKLSKSDYQALVPGLRTELLELQGQLKNADFSAIVVVAGVDGAGKGDTVNLLHEWMDARFLQAHTFGPPTEDEKQRPEYWRYWLSLPPKGRIGIFFGSWYTPPIVNRAYGLIKGKPFELALRRINAFEKALVDDGAVVIKLWLHLSREQQKKRLKRLEKDPETRWRVTETDWKHFGLYKKFRTISEHAVQTTSTGEAPWYIVEGTDPRYRTVTVARHIIDQIKDRIDAPKHRRRRRAVKSVETNPLTILDQVDLTKGISRSDYDRKLEHLQGRLNLLSRRVRAEGLGVILVFEGWDAGGKGGAIRRVTRSLDARQYRAISIAAPTEEEKAQHYLWRFWRQLPRMGHFTIYDRSWYGRVLVERVEGFAMEQEWTRAFQEINEFEEQIVENNTVVIKFWLHIDKDEQLRRFKEREETPWKQYKITEEDYRNREKWNDYEAAVNEMVARTSTEAAPWHLISGNSKHFARIQILETVCDRIQARLGELEKPQGKRKRKK